MKKKSIVKYIIIAIVVLIVGGFLCKSIFFKKNNTDEEGTYEQAIITNIEKTFMSSGVIETNSKSVYGIGGTIVTDNVRVGQSVKEGDILFVFDKSEINAEIKEATKIVNELQSSYDELVKLLEKKEMYSDVSGYISKINVKVGSEISVGDALYSIYDNTKVTVDFDIVNYHKGDNIKLNIDGKNYEGKVVLNEDLSLSVLISTDGTLKEGTHKIIVDGVEVDNIVSYNEVVIVTSTVEGIVTELNVKENDIIEKNKLVVKVKSDNYSKLTDSKDLLDAKKEVLNALKKNANNYIVKAPMSGTITTKNVSKGQIYNAESPMVVISGNEESYSVTVSVEESNLLSFKKGLKATITAQAIPELELVGTVSEIDYNPTSDMFGYGDSSYYNVKIEFKNNSYIKLFAGLHLTVSIVLDSKENVLAVPNEAVYESRYVIRKNPNTGENEEVDVEVGIVDDWYAEIISGLEEGDEVYIYSSGDMYEGFYY